MRSPLAYPLNRAADSDGGGAADLQTDVMRFMAILALCLVAIFALVQSLPMAPLQQRVTESVVAPKSSPEPETVAAIAPAEPPPATESAEKAPVTDADILLTRPQWIPAKASRPATPEAPPEAVQTAVPKPRTEPASSPQADPGPVAPTPVAPRKGFTLRFESDAALARLVATNRIGFYAIDTARARRMAVNESRISFWDASTPGQFHEMEPTTVPSAVANALDRSGTSAGEVTWGVTLPPALRGQLDRLMQQHQEGTLVIEADGNIRREPTL